MRRESERGEESSRQRERERGRERERERQRGRERASCKARSWEGLTTRRQGGDEGVGGNEPAWISKRADDHTYQQGVTDPAFNPPGLKLSCDLYENDFASAGANNRLLIGAYNWL